MKIVSLLPSATEILCALGLADQLAAVTHECDYPAYVKEKTFITRSLLRPDMSSGEIDAAVRSQLVADAHSLYTIDRVLLAEIAPDLIVTQQLCEVCAVAYDDVLDAVRALPHKPVVLNLEPMSLGEVLADIQRVGEATGRAEEARQVVAALDARIARVRETVAQAQSRPRVAFLEWIDPLFCGGHWNPELVEMAGGVDPLGHLHQPSTRIEWEQVRAMQPEVMVISCCGFSAERARQDLPLLEAQPGWAELPCVRANRIHFFNGADYFSRPGPRLVDSLELLAGCLHPQLFKTAITTQV
jgi:iron complex transport system substrate-binding protein